MFLWLGRSIVVCWSVMLDDTARHAIKILRDTAEQNGPLSLHGVLTQQLVQPNQFADIWADDIVWWVGYGIEQQPFGPCRNLSISHMSMFVVPGSKTIRELAREFGYKFKDTQAFIRRYPTRGLTVHVMEPL